MFGNSTTNSGGGLFGNTANTNTTTTGGGGLFGNTANAGTSTTGGGLFGNTSTAAPSGGLFGSTTTTSGTGNLFGGTQPNNTTTQQPSLFGSTTQAPGASLFGAPQQQQQQQSGSLFGQQPKPAGLFGGSTLGTSTLGATTLGGSTLGSTNNLFASKAAVAPHPQQEAQSQFAQLAQRIEATAQAWNPNSDQCRFQVSSGTTRLECNIN